LQGYIAWNKNTRDLKDMISLIFIILIFGLIFHRNNYLIIFMILELIYLYLGYLLISFDMDLFVLLFLGITGAETAVGLSIILGLYTFNN